MLHSYSSSAHPHRALWPQAHRLAVMGMLAALLLFTACSQGNLDMLGMFYTKSELADERFTQSEEYNVTHPFDTIRVSAEAYRVYYMTDVHTDSTTINLDTFFTQVVSDAYPAMQRPRPGQVCSAPFCCCLGDIVNAVGHYPLFQSRVEALERAGVRMYCTPGNHDIYYDQWEEYRSYYHTSHFCVVVRTPAGREDLFIFIDTSSATLGVLQMDWLKNTLREAKAANYRHIIVNTHTHFWKKDQSQGHTSNLPLEETYELAYLFSQYGVELVMQGHGHCRDLQQFKNVKYLRIDALEDHYYNAGYCILHIGDKQSANEGITWQHVPVGPQDASEAYRPID